MSIKNKTLQFCFYEKIDRLISYSGIVKCFFYFRSIVLKCRQVKFEIFRYIEFLYFDKYKAPIEVFLTYFQWTTSEIKNFSGCISKLSWDEQITSSFDPYKERFIFMGLLIGVSSVDNLKKIPTIIRKTANTI